MATKNSSKSINQEQYEKLSKEDKKEYIKEWSCECNECGKKWAYLDSVEKSMKTQAIGNALMCCHPCGAIFSNKSIDISKQIKELKQCSSCKSSNAKCEAKYFKK
jgi:hypothetical protein